MKKKMRVPPLGFVNQFKPIPDKNISVGFCPSGLLSQWAFVLLGFCPVGFCPSGLLSYTHCLLVAKIDSNPSQI